MRPLLLAVVLCGVVWVATAMPPPPPPTPSPPPPTPAPAANHNPPPRRDHADLDERTVVSIIILGLYAPAMMAFSVWMWQRRKCHPIKGRNPALVTACHVALTILLINLSLTDIFHQMLPCIYTYWSFHLIATTAVFLYTVRAWDLYFRNGLTRDRLSEYKAAKAINSRGAEMSVLQSQVSRNRAESYTLPRLSTIRASVDPEDLWFIQHRYMVSKEFLGLAAGVHTVINLLIPALFTVYDPQLRSLDAEPCEWEARAVVTAVVVLAYVAVYIVLAWKLRSVLDAYRIKEELFFTAVCALVTTVVMAALSKHARVDNKGANYANAAGQTILFLIFSASCLWPLYRSFAVHKPRTTHRRRGNVTIEQVLNDPAGIRALEQFLSSEFAVEQLIFYIHALDFEENFDFRDMDTNRDYASEIFCKFVKQNAPSQVNLPGDAVADVERILINCNVPTDDGTSQTGSGFMFGVRRPSRSRLSRTNSPAGSGRSVERRNHDDEKVLESVSELVEPVDEKKQTDPPGDARDDQADNNRNNNNTSSSVDIVSAEDIPVHVNTSSSAVAPTVSPILSPVSATTPIPAQADRQDSSSVTRVQTSTELPPDTFSTCLEETLAVLAQDSFPRFRASKFFKLAHDFGKSTVSRSPAALAAAAGVAVPPSREPSRSVSNPTAKRHSVSSVVAARRAKRHSVRQSRVGSEPPLHKRVTTRTRIVREELFGDTQEDTEYSYRSQGAASDGTDTAAGPQQQGGKPNLSRQLSNSM